MWPTTNFKLQVKKFYIKFKQLLILLDIAVLYHSKLISPHNRPGLTVFLEYTGRPLLLMSMF